MSDDDNFLNLLLPLWDNEKIEFNNHKSISFHTETCGCKNVTDVDVCDIIKKLDGIYPIVTRTWQDCNGGYLSEKIITTVLNPKTNKLCELSFWTCYCTDKGCEYVNLEVKKSNVLDINFLIEYICHNLRIKCNIPERDDWNEYFDVNENCWQKQPASPTWWKLLPSPFGLSTLFQKLTKTTNSQIQLHAERHRDNYHKRETVEIDTTYYKICYGKHWVIFQSIAFCNIILMNKKAYKLWKESKKQLKHFFWQHSDCEDEQNNDMHLIEWGEHANGNWREMGTTCNKQTYYETEQCSCEKDLEDFENTMLILRGVGQKHESQSELINIIEKHYST